MKGVRYNSRQRMRHSLPWLRTIARLAQCALLLAGVSFASQWTPAVTQLAGNVAEISGPGTARLTFHNNSSLNAVQFQEFSRELEILLRGRGLRLVTSNAAVEVGVTASENLRSYVFIAQVQQGRDTKTAIASIPKDSSTNGPGASASVTLKKTYLVTQDEPILDVMMVDGGSQLAVLGSDRLTVYRRDGDQWKTQGTFEINHARPWPLDVRGRLFPATDHSFDAYLPGVVCSSVTLAPAVMTCRTSDDPWPIGEKQSAFYNAARNYFNGVLSPGIGSQSNVDAFYSAIALPRSGYTLWMFTGVDGRVRLTDGKDMSTVRANSAVREWGSDAVTVNGCGRGPLIVAAGSGDSTVVDTLRAYEMPDREPFGVSAAIDMPGPVTALWSQGGQRSATAVVHTLTTGKYDAYSVAITCNQ